MQKNTTTIMFYLSILAVIFACGILVFLFKVIENKNTHTSKVLITLSEKMAEKESLTSLSKKIVEIEDTQKRVRGYFVDPNHIDTFVSYLEGIGTESSTELTVKNINTLDNMPNKVFLNISVRGTFVNLMQALTILENIPYQVSVTRVYLNKELTPEPPAPDPKSKVKTPITIPLPTWRADIDFNILSS